MNRQAAVSQSREHTYTIWRQGRFSDSYPTAKTLPIHNVDSGTLSGGFVESKEPSAADTHSGATVTDFHRVPVLTYSAEKRAEP